jgi:threonine/homoserine/homoserine lactone efflux protein
MLIVGGGAALTAIAAYLIWLSVRSLRASWRARQAERRAVHQSELQTERRQDARREFHPAPGE